MPAEARVAGTVVEAHRGTPDSGPVLRLRVDRLQEGPCRAPLSARVTSAELQDDPPPHGEAFRSGAIVGAIVGGLMWRGPGALTGFDVGLTAGAVHEARNRQEDAWLPRGALLQIEVTAPIDVGRACGDQRAMTSTPAPLPM